MKVNEKFLERWRLRVLTPHGISWGLKVDRRRWDSRKRVLDRDGFVVLVRFKASIVVEIKGTESLTVS